MELNLRRKALHECKYLMIPQTEYGNYYYMFNGEVRDSTHEIVVDKEILFELLDNEDTTCNLTTMLTFQKDSRDAFDEYHYKDGEDFEESELPSASEFDSSSLLNESIAEIQHACNFDRYGLSSSRIMNLIARCLKSGQSIEYTSIFYSVSKATVTDIQATLNKEMSC